MSDSGEAEELDEVTKRTAQFFVSNQTGKRVKTLDVYHKYSDNYRDHYRWENIDDGARSPEGSVRYHTGAFTTGRDWWLVAWIDEDDRFYFTNPNNFRGFMDALEGLGRSMLGDLATQWSKEPTAQGTELVRLVHAISAVVFMPMLNSESTKGFKQHILRAEDAARATEIVLRKPGADDPVTFTSKSGNSNTVYTNGKVEDLAKKLKGF